MGSLNTEVQDILNTEVQDIDQRLAQDLVGVMHHLQKLDLQKNAYDEEPVLRSREAG